MIELQPLDLLIKRNVVETFQHFCVYRPSAVAALLSAVVEKLLVDLPNVFLRDVLMSCFL